MEFRNEKDVFVVKKCGMSLEPSDLELQGVKDARVIILPDTVKYIQDYAFENFESLEEIFFVNRKGERVVGDIISIGEKAFFNTRLKKLYYSQTLRDIGRKAFACTSLETFQCVDYDFEEAESKIVYIDDHCFDDTPLKSLIYSPSLKYLGSLTDSSLESILCKDCNGNIISGNLDNCFDFHYPFSLVEMSLPIGTSFKFESNFSNYLSFVQGLKSLPCLTSIYMSACRTATKISVKLLSVYSEDEVLNMNFYHANVRYLEVRGNISKISMVTYADLGRTVFYGENTNLEYDYSIKNEEMVLPEEFKIFVRSGTLGRKYLEFHCPKNIEDRVYRKVLADFGSCVYVSLFRSQMIIEGENFTLDEKKHFKQMTPLFGPKIIFEEKNKSLISDHVTLYPENLSVKQKSVNDTIDVIQKKLELYSGSEREKIVNRFNQIIMQYEDSLIREKKMILDDAHDFGAICPYDALVLELDNLLYSISHNLEFVEKLKKVRGCKDLFALEVVERVENVHCIEDIISNILFELQSYDALYREKIRDIVLGIILHTEKQYQFYIENLFSSTVSNNFNISDPFSDLKEKLLRLLGNIEDERLRTAILLLGILESSEKDTCDVESILGKVRYFNYVFLELFSMYPEYFEPYHSLVESCVGSLRSHVDAVLNLSGTVDVLEEDEEHYLENSSLLLQACCPIFEVQYQKNIRGKEFESAHCYLCMGEDAFAEEKMTVLKSFLLDILEQVDTLENKEDKDAIVGKVDQILCCGHGMIGTINTLEEIDAFMMNTYKELADVLLKIGELKRYYKNKVLVHKIFV